MDESKMKRKISSWTVLQSICMLGALVKTDYWYVQRNKMVECFFAASREYLVCIRAFISGAN